MLFYQLSRLEYYKVDDIEDLEMSSISCGLTPHVFEVMDSFHDLWTFTMFILITYYADLSEELSLK